MSLNASSSIIKTTPANGVPGALRESGLADVSLDEEGDELGRGEGRMGALNIELSSISVTICSYESGIYAR